jgi:hypothetical protein
MRLHFNILQRTTIFSSQVIYIILKKRAFSLVVQFKAQNLKNLVDVIVLEVLDSLMGCDLGNICANTERY